jgi:radical SAM protein with 4Fe4S-binding SPASM domain
MQNTRYYSQRESSRDQNYVDNNAPSRVVVILTNKCNLKCYFCFQDRKSLPKAMSSEDWMNFIDTLEDNSHITITGGEPLLFKNFEKIFVHASKRHSINIVCNGTFLSKKFADLFLSMKNFMVLSISVDTIGNINRGVKPDQYNKMKEALEYFNNKRNNLNHNAVIDTKTTVIDETAKDLFNIYKHCKEDLKSDTHSFQFLKGSPIQHADKEFQYEKIFEEPNPDVYKNLNDIAEQFNKVRDYCLSNETKCYTHPNFLDFSDKSQNYLNILEKKFNKIKFHSEDYKKCKGPWESVHINADGKIFPCLATSLGDIRDFKNMNDVFKTNVAIKFRDLIREKGTVPACHRCGYLKLK